MKVIGIDNFPKKRFRNLVLKNQKSQRAQNHTKVIKMKQ